MLSLGEIAPDFKLSQHDGVEFRLSTALRTGPIVLFFYPRDFTPICTAEACQFRDMHDELARHGVRVFGVSPQSVEEHRRFRDSHGLTYALLSDPKREVIGTYAGTVLGMKVPFVTRRVTYLISGSGVVVRRIIADFSADAHQDILQSVRNISTSKSQDD